MNWPVSSLAVAEDALVVLAALVHAARPLTEAELAAALDWDAGRVHDALRCVEEYPDVAGALALRSAGPGAYAVAANPAKLTAAQRAGLR